MTAMSGSNRVNRGGRETNNAVRCRMSNRDPDDPGTCNANLGFRLLSAWRRQRSRCLDRLRAERLAPGRLACASGYWPKPPGPRHPVGFRRNGRHGLSRSGGAVRRPARSRRAPAPGAAGVPGAARLARCIGLRLAALCLLPGASGALAQEVPPPASRPADGQVPASAPNAADDPESPLEQSPEQPPDQVPDGAAELPSGRDSEAPDNAEGRAVPDDPAGGPPPAAAAAYPAGVLQGIYLSFWSAASDRRLGEVTRLAGDGLINAVVIDIKDALGRVGFDTRVPEAQAYGARTRAIAELAELVCELQNAGLYVIARMVVFKDAKLAEARPELAIHSQRKLPRVGPPHLSGSTLWRDKRGHAWLDPAAEEVWAYNAALAADAFRSGVDELNLDYIRFPTDGDLRDLHFPVRRAAASRREVLRRFFQYFRARFPARRLSADLFGLVTVMRDDLGIGQVLEDAAQYFDFLCPMVYPSHYPSGFLGFRKPAERAYEVVHHSLAAARDRLDPVGAARPPRARLRPWLQDFNLGAIYGAERVREQIEATREALCEEYAGFLLWNARNVYTAEALR